MSLFQCENCGCVENTALSNQGYTFTSIYDWSYNPELKGKQLCSACGPEYYVDGKLVNNGWHNKFPRKFLPINTFFTNAEGNLEHKETGSTDYNNYVVCGVDINTLKNLKS